MTIDEDLFVLTIKNPEVSDSGRYQCVVRECNDLTCKAYLEVERESILLNCVRSLVENTAVAVLVNAKRSIKSSVLKISVGDM